MSDAGLKRTPKSQPTHEDQYGRSFSVNVPGSYSQLVSYPAGEKPPPCQEPASSLQTSSLEIQQGGDHYKHYPIQPMEYCQKNKIPFAEANAIKYATRHASKGKETDLKKAMHYLQLALELEYGVKSEVRYSDE